MVLRNKEKIDKMKANKWFEFINILSFHYSYKANSSSKPFVNIKNTLWLFSLSRVLKLSIVVFKHEAILVLDLFIKNMLSKAFWRFSIEYSSSYFFKTTLY